MERPQYADLASIQMFLETPVLRMEDANDLIAMNQETMKDIPASMVQESDFPQVADKFAIADYIHDYSIVVVVINIAAAVAAIEDSPVAASAPPSTAVVAAASPDIPAFAISVVTDPHFRSVCVNMDQRTCMAVKMMK